MTVTGDAFNLFVFLEISSLATYVLVGMGPRRKALVAAYQYMLMGTVGATFYVIGVGLLYLVTGTLNFADMAERLRTVEDVRPVLAALAFITVGIGLKLALFPLHQWLPNAYAYAPSMAAAFLAATATKVSVYVLLRYYFMVFDPAALFERLPTRELFIVAVGRGDGHRLAGGGVRGRREAPVRLLERGADRLHHARHRRRQPGEPHRLDRASAQPRRDEGRDLRPAGRHRAARRPRCITRRAHRGPRAAHAAHRVRPGDRGPEPDRHPGHRRASSPSGTSMRRRHRARAVVAGRRDPRELAHRRGLRLARRRGGVPARRPPPARPRARRRSACSSRGARDGRAVRVLRLRHLLQRRRRRRCRDAPAREAA